MIQLTIKIDGMKCGMCESHVCDKIRRVPGVKKVQASHTKGEAVAIIEDNTDKEAVFESVTSQGYRVLSYEECEYQKHKLFHSLFKR